MFYKTFLIKKKKGLKIRHRPVACLISVGRVFRSLGALIAKAQSTFVTSRDSGVKHASCKHSKWMMSVLFGYACFSDMQHILACWNSALCCIKIDITNADYVPPWNRLIMKICKRAISYLVQRGRLDTLAITSREPKCEIILFITVTFIIIYWLISVFSIKSNLQ